MTERHDDIVLDLRDRVRAMRVGVEPPSDLWNRIARQTVRRRARMIAWAAAVGVLLLGGGAGATLLLTDDGVEPAVTEAVVLDDPLSADPFYADRERRFRADLSAMQQRRLTASAELEDLTARLDSARAAFREAPDLAARDRIVRLAEQRYFVMVRIVGMEP
jgi:hypothetical protein